MAIRQMEMDEARRQQEVEEKKAAARKEELLGLRTSAQTGGRTSASDYLRQQGLDPTKYSSNIESKLNSIASGIGMDDPNPGSYYKDVGAQVYGDIESGGRSKAMSELDALFAPSFETKRLPFTVDDPYLAGVEAEERASADEVVRRMLDRGVLTDTGYAAAMSDLDKQAAGVKSRLNEIGTGLIGTGQQSLRDVAGRGREAASTLKAGSPFSAQEFGSEADLLASEFLANLGTGIRSRLSGPLFATAGLANVGGAAQGGQNVKFDPAAAAGLEEDTKKKEEDTTQGPLF